MRPAITLWAIAQLTVAISLAQPIYPLAQTRSVAGDVVLFGGSQSDAQYSSAPDFASWLGNASAGVELDGAYCVTAGGAQFSEIDGSLIRAFGVADVDALSEGTDVVDGFGQGETTHRVRFAVAEPVVYEITGTISTLANGGPEGPCCDWALVALVSIALDQLAVGGVYAEQSAVFAVPYETVQDTRPVGSVGVLAPGVYELRVLASADADLFYLWTPPAVTAEATYVVELRVSALPPAPDCDAADFNGDGAVDLADFAEFQQCFSGPLP